jgi:hypothetical protein
MRTVTGRTAFFAAIGALVVCIALFSMGCNGSGASREKMEEIDKALRTGTSRLTETTAFVAALEEFDFENAAFLEGALNTLDQSRDAAQALLASIDELQALSYGGGLSSLEGYVEEYSTATVEAVEELEAIYTGLQGILQAIEPVLREEAVITQLEEPGSDAELLGRLQRLEAALHGYPHDLEQTGRRPRRHRFRPVPECEHGGKSRLPAYAGADGWIYPDRRKSI